MLGRVNSNVIILLYHRIADVASDPWSLCVTPNNFEEHLRILKKYNFSFPTLGKIQQSSNFNSEKRNVAITFDDGYADNFTYAMPILRKYNIPATFFIVSGVIGSREEFWWDHLERLIIYPQSLPDIIELKIKYKIYHWETKETRIALYMKIWNTFNFFTPQNVFLALNQLEGQIKELFPVRAGYLPLNKDQLMSLSNSTLCEIGAHTANHRMLTHCSPEEQVSEIIQCKNGLEVMIGKKIQSFSYPFGNYSRNTIRFIKNAGFNIACSTRNENVNKNDNAYLLPRREVGNWNGPEFESKISQWLG